MAIQHTRELHRIEYMDDALTVSYIDSFDDPDDAKLPVRTHTTYRYTSEDDITGEHKKVIAVFNALWGE